MPRRKTRKVSKPSPENPLKNITNKTRSRSSKCVVKMQKLDLETEMDRVKDSSNLKRIARESKESDGVSLPKRSSEPPSAEESVEKLVQRYEQLQRVISNKYVTVVDRLKLDFVPLCAVNIEYCHKKHYKKAPHPKLASTTQMNLVRNSVQQSRYKIFISLVWNLCQKEQFPGDVVLTNIVKMLLTLNPESNHNSFLQPILDQLLWLFDVILRRFPPCWLALRPSYMNFLKNTIEMSKLLLDKTFEAKNTIFEVVLMLLEDTVDDRENIRCNRSSRRKNDLSTSLTHFDNEYHNMQHWEKYDNDEQTFSALSKATRLDRLMHVLHLIGKMLEMDLAMWMLRYHKNPTKHIYDEKHQPLVITLFSLSKYTRSSVLTKKVMTLFALCVEKNLDVHYLQVMERFISLLANIQNLCEIETTPVGIRYPYVGPATSSFTMDFFKTTEVYMKKDVNAYIRLIKTIRCPFVRYEYIDHFLKRLNPAVGKMCPQKIVENFGKSRWLECQPEEERPSDSTYSCKQSIIYRQDYLWMLLDALRSYCSFHGTKEYFNEVHSSKKQTVNQSEKQNSNNDEIDLSQMRGNIVDLEAKLDMSMILREPRMEIPVVNIRVDSDLCLKYRHDMKYFSILYTYISALQLEHTDDFSELIDFLKDFA